MKALVASLVGVVGAEHVLTDADMVAGYAVDWTGRFAGSTPAVVRPGSTAEVAAVVRHCRDAGVAVVPQGGNTGLAGGSVPLAGEIVLSLRRLHAVGPVDAAAGQLTAGGGATIGDVQRAAAEAGWAYGVDLGSRDSATVGGTIATNAGGSRMLRYGDTRAQLVGVEAVLGDGSVVSHLAGLVKDNTGYHLPSLLCGSEGTLGVVTAARLRLVPRADERVTALVAFTGLDEAVAGAGALRRQVRSLEAAELVLAAGVDLVCSASGLGPPFAERHPVYVLVEAAASASPLDELAEAVGSLDGVADAAVADDSIRRAELWRYREGHTEAINTLGPPHKLDVTLPLDRLAGFLDAVPATVAALAPAARTWLFGHVADGNVHVNITGVAPDDGAVDDAVLTLVVEEGGSISSEHGIGTAKKAWLARTRSPAELAAFRAVKAALDPAGILNPNALLP
ncbi:MAG TPA: FAD-binding oxidoreductase [Acidimicrobiales bacterium]|nr:FAD-binding oxidoreductase [Acidimicrobiales bacterium]